jgi:hypothetical protein
MDPEHWYLHILGLMYFRISARCGKIHVDDFENERRGNTAREAHHPPTTPEPFSLYPRPSGALTVKT